MVEFGRLLLIIGLTIAFIGLVILVAVRYFPWLGNLPGDFRFESANSKIYFPLGDDGLNQHFGHDLVKFVDSNLSPLSQLQSPCRLYKNTTPQNPSRDI